MNDYDELNRHDEFEMAKGELEVLKEFQEGAKTFDPTYKYNFQTLDYDTSGKNRVPAWCDRILYHS